MYLGEQIEAHLGTHYPNLVAHYEQLDGPGEMSVSIAPDDLAPAGRKKRPGLAYRWNMRAAFLRPRFAAPWRNIGGPFGVHIK